jgi:hypothetical protein
MPLRNCDCGACCEACGHYDDCIRNAAREVNTAFEVAAEDGYRPSRGASEIKHPSMRATRQHLASNPLPGQRSAGAA